MSEQFIEDELRELVQRYRVCWQVLNEYTFLEGKPRQVGFCLELSGTHPIGVEHPQPGCEHCRDVYHSLEHIGAWITPKEVRPSYYEIQPFDSAIRYESAHKNRPDVTLKIKVLHRNDGFAPVDACEVQCLKDMKERLTEIGAASGSWSAARKAS